MSITLGFVLIALFTACALAYAASRLEGRIRSEPKVETGIGLVIVAGTTYLALDQLHGLLFEYCVRVFSGVRSHSSSMICHEPGSSLFFFAIPIPFVFYAFFLFFGWRFLAGVKQAETGA